MFLIENTFVLRCHFIHPNKEPHHFSYTFAMTRSLSTIDGFQKPESSKSGIVPGFSDFACNDASSNWEASFRMEGAMSNWEASFRMLDPNEFCIQGQQFNSPMQRGNKKSAVTNPPKEDHGIQPEAPKRRSASGTPRLRSRKSLANTSPTTHRQEISWNLVSKDRPQSWILACVSFVGAWSFPLLEG